MTVENNEPQRHRERFLDHFPVSDDELDALLDYFETRKSSSSQPPPQTTQMLEWALSNVFVMGFEQESARVQEQANFLEAVVSVLGRRGGGEAYLHRLLYHVVATTTSNNKEALDARHRMQFLWDLVQLVSEQDKESRRDNTQSPLPNSWVRSLQIKASSDGIDDNTVSWSDWNSWCTDCAPWIHTVVPTLFHALFFGSKHPRRGPSWSLPHVYCPAGWDVALGNHSDSDKSQPSRSNISTLAPLSAMLGPSRHLYALYSSFEHGLSFARLQQALLGYVGPTLFVLGTKPAADSTLGTGIVGYYTQAPWKSSGAGWHGLSSSVLEQEELGNDAFLFSLHPVWTMYPRTYDDTMGGLQWLQMGRSKLPYSGLAVGGLHPDTPRLHITESLDQCRVLKQDRSFVSGPLIVPNADEADDEAVWFDVDWIDVYAVVAPESSSNQEEEHDAEATARAEFESRRAAGQRQLDVREWHRQKAAHVDKAQFVDDLAGGVLPSKLYAHRDQARGRASFVANEDEGLGYYVEGKEPSQKDSFSSSAKGGKE